MIEVLRRVVLVLGVYGALVAVLHARPGVIEARLEDFAARQASRPAWSGDRDLSLAAFIESTTEGRLVVGSGPGWADLAQAARAAIAQEGPAGRWAQRRGDGGSRACVFLLPGEAPLADVAPTLSHERPFVYARVDGQGGLSWLALTWRRGRDVDGAPVAVVRPLRRWWPWSLLFGVGLYALLPRRRRGPRTLGYSSVRAAVLPDVVGLMLGAVFLLLPLLVAPSLAPDGRTFTSEAWPLFAVAGIFVALAWTIHGWAAWYAAFRLDLEAGGLRLRTLGGERHVRYADLVEAKITIRQAPTALRRAMWLAALFSVRALGQALLISSRTDPELLLRERGGRQTRILYTALDGGERLLASLAAAGHAPHR